MPKQNWIDFTCRKIGLLGCFISHMLVGLPFETIVLQFAVSHTVLQPFVVVTGARPMQTPVNDGLTLHRYGVKSVK